jgi:hypothetical protein
VVFSFINSINLKVFKMKKLRISIIALVATFAMISSSFAFEGLSFGGIYNDATFDVSGREMKGQKNSANEASARTSISKSQAYGSYFVEYTLPQGSTFGIELIPGDASLGAKTRVHTLNGTGQNVAGTITAKAEVSDHTLIYAEPTKMFNDSFGIYLKGGISKVTVNTLDSQQQQLLLVLTEMKMLSEVHTVSVLKLTGEICLLNLSI